MRYLRCFCLYLFFSLLLLLALPASAETLRDCHRVENHYTDTTQANKSVIRLWQVSTPLDSVTDAINSIAQGWADELGPTLQKAANSGKKNSRLDVEIRYSRTGLRWMSFMVQARETYHQQLTGQQFTTRTFDMISGEQIFLTDLFAADSPAWDLLTEGVRSTLSSYWPSLEADPAALDALCSREAIEKADFTLHGMSLVLHYPASALYAEKYTLMEVPFYYPSLYPFMTETGFAQTDNASYYSTCALTFDDGPSGTNTPKVLNALMEKGARATFFVIGNRIADYPCLVQREHDDGHAIGSHNWHHGNVTKSSGSALRAMPEKVNKAMNKVIGIPVRYDRVPGGRYPAMVKAKVGWSYIQWSLDTYDWRGLSTAKVLSKVQKKIQDGDIILCHDIKDNAPESTRQIVSFLEENGYMLLTIDELFAKDNVTLEPNKVYYHCQDGDTSIRKD